MRLESDVAPVAALLAEPARGKIMTALMDGRALPAGELARIAGVSAQTASSHLAKLESGGLVRVHVQGRHRYYAIATGEIAHAIETLSAIAPAPEVRSLRQSLEMQRLSAARTCYDHLAGALAVQIADRLVARGDCERHDSGFAVTPQGIAFFHTLEIDVPRLLRTDRPFARACIDWTQRRQHVSGALGKALLHKMLDNAWLARGEERRSLDVTQHGFERLKTHFDIDSSVIEMSAR
jgi:DNA-binding transcriptional ArsR family regulator